jgi:hypothetical protein
VRSRGKRVSYAEVESDAADSDASDLERAKRTKKKATPKARAPAAVGTKKKKKLLAWKPKAAKRARDVLEEEESSDAFATDSDEEEVERGRDLPPPRKRFRKKAEQKGKGALKGKGPAKRRRGKTFTGVFPRGKRWHVKISRPAQGGHPRRQEFVGAFDSEVAAKRAYADAAEKMKKGVRTTWKHRLELQRESLYCTDAASKKYSACDRMEVRKIFVEYDIMFKGASWEVLPLKLTPLEVLRAMHATDGEGDSFLLSTRTQQRLAHDKIFHSVPDLTEREVETQLMLVGWLYKASVAKTPGALSSVRRAMRQQRRMHRSFVPPKKRKPSGSRRTIPSRFAGVAKIPLRKSDELEPRFRVTFPAAAGDYHTGKSWTKVYLCEEEGAHAYDDYIRKHKLKGKRVNFPQ